MARKIKLKIRSAEIDDIPEIQKLLQKTGLYFEPIDRNPQGYERQIGNDWGSMIVSEYENKVVGVVMFIWSPLYSVIFHLAVQPSHQRIGIGKSLLKEAIARLTRRGTLYIASYVTEQNTASHALCNSVGLKSYGLPLIARYLDVVEK